MAVGHESLKGKVAVVTGGSGILCRAMAKELAIHGMKVAILNRTKEKARQLPRKLGNKAGRR